MPINLTDSWNGENLSDIREFIQAQLKKGFINVTSTVANGKVVLTFTKADGTTTKAEFKAAEGETGDGYLVNFRMTKKQSIYGSGNNISFSYSFNHTMDGEEVIGVAPTIVFEAFTVDNNTNPVKSIWSTQINSSAALGTIEIPVTVVNGIEGTILIKGTCTSTYQGQEVVVNRQMTVYIATCEISFASSFALNKHVKGYAANASMTEALIDYVGTNPAELQLYVDGTLKKSFTDILSGSTTDMELSMEGLTDGMHTAQIIAKMDTGTVDSETSEPIYIYSKGLLFDFYRGISGKHIGIRMNINDSNIIEDPVNNLNVNTEQYVNTTIVYAASEYDSSNKVYKNETAVTITKDGIAVSGLAVGHEETHEYTFRDTEIINYKLSFDVEANNRKINVKVSKNKSGVSVASGAAINISCAGRNNNENSSVINTLPFTDNSGNSYTGVLTNFLHNIKVNDSEIFVDGWDGKGLVFKGSAALNLPYAPFGKFSRSTGYYIEFNINVAIVLDENEYIISTLNSEGVGGFYLKAEEAGIITKFGTKVYTYIAANTTYNIAFMVNTYTGTKNGQPEETTLLELYVNGIRTAVTVFASTDSFDNTTTINMSGKGAVWTFYGMRVYNAVLKPLAIYNNYLTTLFDGDEIVRLAEENDILNTAKTAIDYQKMLNKGKNVLIVEVGDGEEKCVIDSDYLGKLESEATGSILESQVISTKDQFLSPSAKKKTNFLVKGLTYYNNGKLTDPYSFECGPTLMQVQGTSSTYYSRKNYDIFFTGQKYSKRDSISVWTSKFNTEYGETAIENINTVNVKYKMSAIDSAVPCLCLKADYSDSSNLHNTQLTTLINDVWFGLKGEYLTPPQHNVDTYYQNVRVGINGHPIDVFVKDGTTYTYIGQYNMNNEKKDSHHVYGFDGTTGNTAAGKAICIEFLENNRTATLFNAGSNFNWETCSDTTDESGEAIPQLEFRYPSNDWVDASENEKAAVKRVFTWVKDCYDNFVSSYNEITGQYTSTKFVEEVKQYFNLKNLCSWYLYTEYFLAVDQRSKNMMLASWGATPTSGIWYFLPYDSDTSLGVTNDGWLILPWDSDENTRNPLNSSQYAYMGHDSNLWKLVRHYLYDDTYIGTDDKYGLSGYTLQDIAKVLRNETISNTLFNTGTIKKYMNRGRRYWADMTYNFDSDTKYIAPLTYQSDRGTKNDFAQFVQGARDAHRDWLINKRFNLLDSKYSCGFFDTDVHSMKLSKTSGTPCSIKVRAKHTGYVQLIQNTTVVTRVKLTAGEEATVAVPTELALTDNDPIALQGFSIIEYLDFDTTSNHLSAGMQMPSRFTNLKTLIINGTVEDNPYKGEGLGYVIKDLPNIRNIILKGFHVKKEFTTPILDLSNNLMLETVDIDCEALTAVIMPYSYHNIKKFNVGNLNIQVPWEFWNELNDYYTRTQNSCIFVGELVDRNLTYTVYAGNNTAGYIVSDKYFVYVLPYTGLGFDGSNNGIFGANSTTRNQVNLKRIIYAKVDSSLFLRTTDSMGMGKLYAGCSNLISINTKGWNCDFTRNKYNRNVWFGNIMDHCPCSEIDLSFIKTGYFTNNTNTIAASSDAFTNLADTVTYIKYGTGWFNLTVVSKNRNTATTICTSSNMNAQHYIDLAEDLPDVTSLDLTEIARTLKIGDNFNNYDKFPQTVRDKILAKGWLITQ